MMPHQLAVSVMRVVTAFRTIDLDLGSCSYRLSRPDSAGPTTLSMLDGGKMRSIATAYSDADCVEMVQRLLPFTTLSTLTLIPKI